MKLATLKNGTPDGRLHIVSRDLTKALAAPGVQTLQQLMEDWEGLSPALISLYDQLNSGALSDAILFDPAQAMAPLPRAWQWLDGSAFDSHGDLMDMVLGVKKEKSGRPLMYQGVSNRFLAPQETAHFPSEADDIDFEGEFGVITDQVPLGISAEAAIGHIRLLVQINDWSLRRLAPIEMRTGFGWVQAKPLCSMAPVAVTPDELGSRWRDGRVDLNLVVHWNDKQFGAANGYAMSCGFHDLVAHAAYSRELAAGTVIGSGTVSNSNYREVGSSCIAERRGIEIIDEGKPKTTFMRYGDTVRMEARLPDGAVLFGAIEQTVAKA
ncbi:fumarylacetoacetate hydrolase family protein [Allorhizobium sp. BGMRC 0089]|uniref:fumarylacetoacetate hydrolase family protein n=1 Tax=Allorhizobium sonneratiae TaxID=2934936 RepID=UPI0020344CA6|nr:fumarylacetoacetate hydrolase family protein [Allorhizobium sonneratiae]MCM2294010.1 fumarylacetoacetate hydrolase family protein [Allorhizobium sonneratiae]